MRSSLPYCSAFATILAVWTVIQRVGTKSSSVCLALDERDDKAFHHHHHHHHRADDDDNVFGFQSCPERCHIHTTSLSPNNTTTILQGLRIFYLILIHNNRTANDAVFLLRAIRDPRNSIVIHFDKKVEHLLQDESSLLLREIADCPCGSNIRVDSVHSVEWSKWSMNLPTLWGMELAASNEYVDRWDVFINLSGDTIPVYTADTIATTLQELPYNFLTSRSCETGLKPTNVYLFPKFWHKRRHYTIDETEQDPVFTYAVHSTGERRHKTITTYFGSQWVILQRHFLRWLVDKLQDDDSWPSQFRDYLQASGRLMTDETFLPTVLMHAHDADNDINDASQSLPAISENGVLLWRNGSVSTIRDIRFERMDEHYPTAFGDFPETQRYQVPESLVQSNILDQPKVWGPYFLGVYDLGQIRDSGALFARKVSALVDPNMVWLLPVDRTDQIPNIRWPTEVSLTDRPDWHVEKELWNEMVDSKQRASLKADEKDEEL